MNSYLFKVDRLFMTYYEIFKVVRSKFNARVFKLGLTAN